MQEGEGVRAAEQGVRGAAPVVGGRVPGQETRLWTARGGTLFNGTLDDVIYSSGEKSILNAKYIIFPENFSYLESSLWNLRLPSEVEVPSSSWSEQMSLFTSRSTNNCHSLAIFQSLEYVRSTPHGSLKVEVDLDILIFTKSRFYNAGTSSSLYFT